MASIHVTWPVLTNQVSPSGPASPTRTWWPTSTRTRPTRWGTPGDSTPGCLTACPPRCSSSSPTWCSTWATPGSPGQAFVQDREIGSGTAQDSCWVHYLPWCLLLLLLSEFALAKSVSIQNLLSRFRNMRAAVLRGDWSSAADEMVDSAWYGQVGRRSRDLVRRMRSVRWGGGWWWICICNIGSLLIWNEFG